MVENDRVTARVTLGLLFLLNTMLILDKIVLTILLEPIKEEFGLNDFQLGLLAGAAYAVCIGIASLPFGYLVDRYNRKKIAAICLATWSAMTALCGMAQNFGMLLMARLGLGIGEAGGGPASLSIISDLFEHRRRATAMAIFSLGTPAAGLLNLTVNTQVAHAYGWRAAFLVASIPGLLIALAILLFLREPMRQGEASSRPDAPSLRTTLQWILATPSLLFLLGGVVCAYTVLAGVSSWNFSFLIREHGAKLNEIGPILGVGIATAGIVGLFGAGRMADILAQRDERWRSWIMAITTLASVLCGWAAFTADSLWPAVAFTCGFAGLSSLWMAPGFALSQSLVPSRMRGTVGAIIFMLTNVVGYGLGPPLVGFESDLFATAGVPNPLTAALIASVGLNLVAALLFMLCGRSLIADLARSEPMPAQAKGG